MTVLIYPSSAAVLPFTASIYYWNLSGRWPTATTPLYR